MPTIPVLGENDPSNINVNSIPGDKFQTGQPIYSSVRNAIDRLATVVANALYETIGASAPNLESSAADIKLAFETALKNAVKSYASEGTTGTYTPGNIDMQDPEGDMITLSVNGASKINNGLDGVKCSQYAYMMAGYNISNRSLAMGVLANVGYNTSTSGNADFTIDSANERLNLTKTIPFNSNTSTVANVKFNIPGIKIVNGVMYVTKTNVS